MFDALIRKIVANTNKLKLLLGFQIARRDKNGLLHCVDGPALIYPKDKVMGNGYEYYIHGNRHRENGPAVVWGNGHREYWIDGKLHREDGPAIDSPNYKAYWVNGEKVTEFDVCKIENGNKIWRNKEGGIHRINGPAFISSSGHHKQWCQNGLFHREDGPAYIGPGLEGWYVNGKLHREDGPAIICPDGRKYYYLNGKQVAEEKFLQALDQRNALSIPPARDEKSIAHV